jgi:membrane protease YdiL (CAAX protease family)
VEELLFRWFFPALLWPMLGYGVLLAAPAINLIWHLPVWWDYAGHQQSERKGAALAAVALPATGFALALTVLAVLTHNLAGVVLAHAFGDWAGSVVRHRSQSAA